MQGCLGFTQMGGSVEQVIEHVPNHAGAINYVGNPTRQQPQHTRHTEGPAQPIGLVDQQGVGQLVASGKTLVTAGVIATHAPNLGTKGLKICIVVAEGASLHGAAGGVVFGIEKEHQCFACQLVAAVLGSVLIAQGNQGGGISNGKGHGG